MSVNGIKKFLRRVSTKQEGCAERERFVWHGVFLAATLIFLFPRANLYAAPNGRLPNISARYDAKAIASGAAPDSAAPESNGGNAQVFYDARSHWAKDAIMRLYNAKIVSGRGDGNFDPNAHITRAEFCVMLNRAFDIPDGKALRFSDVPQDSAYYADIKKAVSAGYLSGYDDNAIKPGEKLTRAQAAVILRKLLKLQTPSNTDADADAFSDAAQIPEWAADAVRAITAYGVMSGYPDGTFLPQNPLTRAEACVATARALDCGHEPNEKTPSEPKQNITIDSDYGAQDKLETINGDVTVIKNNITISNLIINGDLIIESAAGEGSISLINVKVNGRTYMPKSG